MQHATHKTESNGAGANEFGCYCRGHFGEYCDQCDGGPEAPPTADKIRQNLATMRRRVADCARFAASNDRPWFKRDMERLIASGEREIAQLERQLAAMEADDNVLAAVRTEL